MGIMSKQPNEKIFFHHQNEKHLFHYETWSYSSDYSKFPQKHSLSRSKSDRVIFNQDAKNGWKNLLDYVSVLYQWPLSDH